MTGKKREHTFHRNNCQSKVRKSHTKRNGVVISLLGKHGFEWSVAIKAPDKCFLTITVFPQGRQAATKYYEQLCKQD